MNMIVWIVSINLNVSSSLNVSNYTNISVITSFKVDLNESKKINVNMIANVNEYQYRHSHTYITIKCDFLISMLHNDCKQIFFVDFSIKKVLLFISQITPKRKIFI